MEPFPFLSLFFFFLCGWNGLWWKYRSGNPQFHWVMFMLNLLAVILNFVVVVLWIVEWSIMHNTTY